MRRTRSACCARAASGHAAAAPPITLRNSRRLMSAPGSGWHRIGSVECFDRGWKRLRDGDMMRADVRFVPTSVRLFDHFVGAPEQNQRDGEAKRLSRLEVNHQLKLGWLLDGQHLRLFSIKNTAAVHAGLTIRIGDVRAVAHQTTRRSVLVKRVYSRNGVYGGQRHQSFAMAVEKWLSRDSEFTRAEALQRRECVIELLFRACIDWAN